MGGLMSRNKGKRGEREVIHLLQPHVDDLYGQAGLAVPRLQRNTLQSDGGGFDIVGLEWLALEVKFQEQLAVESWWKQTLDQCGPGQVPVLFYRRSHAKWKIRTFGYIRGVEKSIRLPIDAAVDHWVVWFRHRLGEELQRLT